MSLAVSFLAIPPPPIAPGGKFSAGASTLPIRLTQPLPLPSTVSQKIDSPPAPARQSPGTDVAVQTGWVSRLCQQAISGYQHVTRKGPISKTYQQHGGKCFHRTVGHNDYSCSEYGLRAYQLYHPAWATALTALKVVTCGPHTDLTPLGQLFDHPLSPTEFKQKRQDLTRGLPLIDWGTRQDWRQFGHLMLRGSLKEIEPAIPPQRAACLDLNPMDWLHSLLWAEKTKPHLYQDGVINPHLAPRPSTMY